MEMLYSHKQYNEFCMISKPKNLRIELSHSKAVVLWYMLLYGLVTLYNSFYSAVSFVTEIMRLRHCEYLIWKRERSIC